MRTHRVVAWTIGWVVAAGGTQAQQVPVDPVFASGLESGASAFGPNFTAVAQGAIATPTAPIPLRLNLSEPAASNTFVPVVSADPTRLSVVDGGVTVLTGQSSAQVLVNGLIAGATPVTLTARLGNTLAAGVRVERSVNETDLAEEADFCVLQFPANLAVVAGAQTTLIFGQLFQDGVTVLIGPPSGWHAEVGFGPPASDPRALSGWYFSQADYNVQIGNNDEFMAALTAPVMAGTYSYGFRFSNNSGASWTFCDLNGAGANPGLTFETAQLGVMTVTQPPHLVINEVDYEQVGGNTAEFIEIYNPAPVPADLSGKSLLLVNGADNTVYLTVNLGIAGSVPAGGYLVVRSSAVAVAPGALSILFATDLSNIHNGAPDGIALIDTIAGTLIDALSYEGSITDALIPPPVGTVSLVEGIALAVTTADTNTAVGALARLPNGTDSDNASSDWGFSTTLTPGAANVP